MKLRSLNLQTIIAPNLYWKNRHIRHISDSASLETNCSSYSGRFSFLADVFQLLLKVSNVKHNIRQVNWKFIPIVCRLTPTEASQLVRRIFQKTSLQSTIFSPLLLKLIHMSVTIRYAHRPDNLFEKSFDSIKQDNTQLLLTNSQVSEQNRLKDFVIPFFGGKISYTGKVRQYPFDGFPWPLPIYLDK